MMDLNHLLSSTVQHSASDLHLQAGSPAMLRIHGRLTPLQTDALTGEIISGFVKDIATDAEFARLEDRRALDMSHRVEGLGRFRVAIFYEQEQLSVVFRHIPSDIPKIEELNLPPVIGEIAQIERGLVVVTGTTGSGKSTTLAAMIDLINHSRHNRIITIEDPIEFVHTPAKSLIAQREIGADATGFLASLRESLRQDPDVILVGELRDQETMTTALQAADTGHAVFSTIHTTTASQTIQRIVAMFPAEERELMLMQLAANLEAVISQRLARTADGKGRIPVVEVLIGIPIVKKLLLENTPDKLPQAIASRENGMQLFDQHLSELYRAEKISGTEAMRLATNPEAVSLSKHKITTTDLQGGLIR